MIEDGILQALSDDELKQLSTRAKHILDERAARKRLKAVSEIHRLAKLHGIDLGKESQRKRGGRPRKPSKAA